MRRWARSADGRAVAVLVGLPILVFVVPALFGHPAVSGDDVLQNLPLRVLTADDLRQGHLPLWNPYIWSGSPLLGGLNAGSAYPFTFLFVFLPPVAAWVVNLLVIYWAAGLGIYVMLRGYRVRPLAAALAGLTYAFTGAMSGQIVHIGLVQGLSLMPWLIFAQLRLSWAVLGTGPRGGAGTGGRTSSRWPWIALLAAVIALLVLTGEPRSMAGAEVLASVVTVWLALHPYGGAGVGWRRRAAFVGWSALAAVWGVVVTAYQIVPGWSFINASQRSVESYQYFGAGSLRPSWTALLLVPDLFGGDGILHQPSFFNSYNLTEVTGYVGLLPLVAAVALFFRCFHRRRDPRVADWALWLVLAGLGLLLTWGSFTPLGHVFFLIPLFGKTRLQSRNVAVVDMALAMLLGFWADRALGPRPEEAGLGVRTRWLAVLPAAAAAVLCLVGIAVPGPLEQAFGVGGRAAVLGRDMTPWFVAGLVVAVAAGALVLGWRRWDPVHRRRWLTAVVVVDIALFTASSSAGLTDGHATIEPTPAAAAAVLGTTGRFAIYSPGGPTEVVDAIGQPDLNAFTKLPSIQGYGSILYNSYGTATGTHTLDSLNVCALADGELSQLRLAILLTTPGFLAPGVGSDGQVPPPPPACPGAPTPAVGDRRTFYLGWEVPVSSVHLVRASGVSARRAAGRLRLGVLGPEGQERFPKEVVHRTEGGWTVRLASPQTAYGLVVTGPARAVSDTSVVTATTGDRYALDGALQDALSARDWRLDGTWKIYARFKARTVRPPVWIAGRPATTAAATAHLVRTTPYGSAVVRVTAARPATVVWSEAYAPGWHAVALPTGGGRSVPLTVEASGLVQSVRVPAGSWTVTFGYRPRGLDAGIAASGIGLAGFVLAGAWGYRRRRARLAAGLPAVG